jgi:hypothetical protein
MYNAFLKHMWIINKRTSEAVLEHISKHALICSFEYMNKAYLDHHLSHGPLTRGRITSCFLSEGVMKTFLTKIFF